MVFPAVMYGCESWTIKKAEGWRIDAFELWCWRGLLSIPWTARRSKQSILKEISPEYSLEGLMLKLKFQYFGHLTWRPDSLEQTLKLEKIEGRGRRGWQIEMVGGHHWLDGQELEQTPGVGDGQVWCSPWSGKKLDMPERLNWTDATGEILVLQPGITHVPSALEGKVLTTRLPNFTFNWVTCFLIVEVWECFTYFYINPLTDRCFAKVLL